MRSVAQSQAIVVEIWRIAADHAHSRACTTLQVGGQIQDDVVTRSATGVKVMIRDSFHPYRPVPMTGLILLMITMILVKCQSVCRSRLSWSGRRRRLRSPLRSAHLPP